MEYLITGGKVTDMNLFPDSIVSEIIQNIRVILTTLIGTVPLDRKFGISSAFIDEPVPRVMMRSSICVLESIQDYEPRVEVLEVDFVPSADAAYDGRLFPKVKVRILDEYLT